MKMITISVLITIILLEITLQLFLAYKPFSFFPWNEDVWERLFIDEYEKGSLMYEALHKPHETRGWTPKPNQSIEIAGYHYTTNSMGHRSIRNYQYDPQEYTVLVLGDSFTFGIDANDREDWPGILQLLDERLNVINLGVGGYGIDQMYITLKETIKLYKPHLVVAAYIDDNLKRSLLSFRHYKKPRFVIRNNKIELTNTPIGSLKKVYKEVKAKHSRYRLAVPEVLKRVFNLGKENLFEINSLIIEEMMKTSKEHKAEFLLVHLAWGNSIREGNSEDEGEAFIQEFINTHDLYAIMTREHFLSKKQIWSKNHYSRKEAELVAQLVLKKLRELPTWKKYLRKSL